MTFFQSIGTVFRKYAEFGGRASRPEFWWFALFSALVSAALNALSVPMSAVITGATTSAMSGRMLWTEMTPGNTSSYVSFAGVWSIVVLLPSLAVTIRRLRDSGHTWAQLLWLLLPIAGLIILIVRLCEPSLGTPPLSSPTPLADSAQTP